MFFVISSNLFLKDFIIIKGFVGFNPFISFEINTTIQTFGVSMIFIYLFIFLMLIKAAFSWSKTQEKQ